MRYLLQFIVPALIVLITVYLLGRRRRQMQGAEPGGERSSNRDTPLLALILVLGATIAIALVLTFAPAVS
jgi:hypothetical protein